jgi:hypothetical protein
VFLEAETCSFVLLNGHIKSYVRLYYTTILIIRSIHNGDALHQNYPCLLLTIDNYNFPVRSTALYISGLLFTIYLRKKSKVLMIQTIRRRFLFNNQPDALIIQIYSFIKLYMFRAYSLPIIRSSLLYIRHG